LLDRFPDSTEEVRGTESAIVAGLILRRPARLIRPTGLPVGRAIRRPVRRLGAHQGHQPLIQVLVNSPQLVVARDVVGGEPDPGEHDDQDQAVPGLEPPPDGVKDHSML
jgi:hypothetical protein